MLALLFLWFLKIKPTDGSDYCCCCERSGFYELNRVWMNSNECKSPKICCELPSKYECELELNPTFDGSCGHMNERNFQKKNGGKDPQIIPRNGYSDSEDIYGWFGERLIDNKGNEIQEWCFDNQENDSFFLWRFVNCNGTYPHWFGRCSFPAATNKLMYKTCTGDEYDEFTSTVPNCFGQVQHTNIGLSTDEGKDIDYRYFVSSETESIWCSDHNKPKDPPLNALYNGHAFGKGDGFVPFYLSECRASGHAPVPADNMTIFNEMTSFKFGINIDLDESLSELPFDEFMFSLSGNNLPSFYECELNQGDYWSLGINYKILNVITPKHWVFHINELDDASSFITFRYKGPKSIVLNENIKLDGFKIKLSIPSPICSPIGWIARSAANSGHFDGFGKIKLCS